MAKGWAACLLVLVFGATCKPASDDERFGHEVARPGGKRSLAPLTAVDRLAAIRGARVWLGGDVDDRDLLRGPSGAESAPGGELRCTFVEPRADRIPPTGATPKFLCAKGGEALLVKYGSKEVHAEVLGTRLLWALGFPADRITPVRVRCQGCPVDPWSVYRRHPVIDDGPRAERLFERAIVKRRFPGQTLERTVDQGWSWEELEQVRARDGGSPRAHVDALKLLAAFMQHGDSKAENHRLLCPESQIDRAGGCRRAIMMVSDLGSTFGGGAWLLIGSLGPSARARLDAWSHTPVWKDRAACRARLSGQFEWVDPIISEPGRQFLAERLADLDDDQLRDLITVSDVTALGERVREPDGSERVATVDDWIAAFKARRDDIVDARCP